MVSAASRGPGRPRNDDTTTASLSQDPGPDLNVVPPPCDADALEDLWESHAPSSLHPSLDISLPVELPFSRIASDQDGPPHQPRAILDASQAQPQLLLDSSVDLDHIPADLLPDPGAKAFDNSYEFGSIAMDWDDFDFMDGTWNFPSSVSASTRCIKTYADLFIQGMSETWLETIDPLEMMAPTLPLNDGTFMNDNHEDLQMTTAVGIMIDYFQRRSRASSPCEGGARWSWYSAPPRLQMYDAQMINILLNIAKAHLSTTFRIFTTFEASSKVSEELCLAMASIGSLFAEVEGSHIVAKALYNDARRLHMEAYLSREKSSFSELLNSATTFLLLEIYGVCSGDKRSYEFFEAFHYDALTAFKVCWEFCPEDLAPAQESALELLSEALDIIDNYRSILLQRPPCFLSLDDTNCRPLQRMHHRSASELTSLMTPVGAFGLKSGTLRNIAVIGAYTWLVGPRGGQFEICCPQLWRPEFVELALERWMDAACSSSDCEPAQIPVSVASRPQHPGTDQTHNLSKLLLYHLAYINLHSNLVVLQRFAHRVVAAAASPGPNSRSSTSLLDEQKDVVSQAIQSATGGGLTNFQTALWHAKSLMRIAKEAIAPTHTGTISSSSGMSSSSKSLNEPPHLPFCMYFATLIIWYGEWRNDGGGTEHSRDACVDVATHLLDRLRISVARVMAIALRELLSEERKSYSR